MRTSYLVFFIAIFVASHVTARGLIGLTQSSQSQHNGIQGTSQTAFSARNLQTLAGGFTVATSSVGYQSMCYAGESCYHYQRGGRWRWNGSTCYYSWTCSYFFTSYSNCINQCS